MSDTIHIENLGAIRSLDIPISPGVVVLRGRNGTGKTTALETTERLLDGQTGGLEARYGAVSGHIEGFGARMSIAVQRKRAAATGELAVVHLEGADIGRFVDPGIQNPERADAARIQELCRLLDLKPSIALVEQAMGVAQGALEAHASARTGGAETLPDLVAGLKRDLQAAAREAENAANKARGAAQALLQSTSGDIALEDLGSTANERKQHEELIRGLAKMSGELEEHRRSTQAALAAREALDEAEASYSGPDAASARALAQQAEDTVARIHGELEAALDAYNQAKAAADMAEKHEADMAKWRESLAAFNARQGAPTDADIDDMRRLVDAAERRVEAAVTRDAAQLKLAQAREHATQAAAADRRAVDLRDLADATEVALSTQIAKIAPKGLVVRDGLLVLETPQKTELYARLSHGERWRIAMDIALDAIPDKPGQVKVLTVRQEAWEGLDPDNRRAVHEHARARDCVVLTAEADGGELRAEALDF